VCLQQGPLSLVSTIEELLGRKNSGCGLEIREYCHRERTILTELPPLVGEVSANFCG
jgi:hypothetical protein